MSDHITIDMKAHVDVQLHFLAVSGCYKTRRHISLFSKRAIEWVQCIHLKHSRQPFTQRADRHKGS